ncbi:MAG: hypothetical protein ACREUU_01200, partial [Gammaproteobacteria bacterium]
NPALAGFRAVEIQASPRSTIAWYAPVVRARRDGDLFAVGARSILRQLLSDRIDILPRPTFDDPTAWCLLALP